MDSERRRHRRLRGADAPARLPARPRRHRDLADAVPAVARHATTATTSPTTTASIRATARSATSSSSPTARKQRGIRVHHRPRRQPHLRPASLVPGGAAATRIASTATGTSGRRRSRRTPTRAWCFPGVQKTTWTRDTEARRVLLPPLLRVPARPQHANPEVQAEILKIMGFWLQLGVSGFRMDAVPFVIATKGAEVTQAGRAVRHAARRSASSCSGGRATRSSSPRPTCCPKPTWSTSATTATACT